MSSFWENILLLASLYLMFKCIHFYPEIFVPWCSIKKLIEDYFEFWLNIIRRNYDYKFQPKQNWNATVECNLLGHHTTVIK